MKLEGNKFWKVITNDSYQLIIFVQFKISCSKLKENMR